MATREVSYTPVAAYTRQGGSQRIETGLTSRRRPSRWGPCTAIFLYPAALGPSTCWPWWRACRPGRLRLGYSYDVGLSRLSADLGGAHEVTLALRAFDRLENAHRRLKKRVYPIAPCPAF